jgi:Tfp pilus assembly protein PilF
MMAFGSGIRGVFLYDDVKEIAENPNLRTLWPLTTPLFRSHILPVRPVPYLTFALNETWQQNNVIGFHVVNIGLHICSAWLLYAIVLFTLARTRYALGEPHAAPILACLISLIWLIHPLQTQAVTYIYQRMELLFAFFLLLTWWTFIKAVSSPTLVMRQRWLISSVMACYLGMLSKEVMVIAPILILWYDRVFIVSSWRELLTLRWKYYLGLSLGWVLLAILIQSQAALYVENTRPMPTAWEYLLTESQVIFHYLNLSFWPRQLCFDYGWPIVTSFSTVQWEFGLLAGLFAITLYLMWWKPAWGFVAGLFFLILAPTSSIKPVLAPCCEYRMYLPLAMLISLVVLLGYALGKRLGNMAGKREMITITLILLCGSCIMLSYSRCSLYADYRQLWEDTSAKAPHNFLPHYLLSRYYAEHDEPILALRSSQKAVELNPHDADAMNNLGLCLIELNQLPEAKQTLQTCIEKFPQHADAYANLGVLSAMQGEMVEARKYLEQAIHLNPQQLHARLNLARILLETQQDVRGAQTQLIEILKQDPQQAQAIELLQQLRSAHPAPR